MNLKTILTAAAFAAASSASAVALDVNVPFTGEVGNYCALEVTQDGVLNVSADFQTLTSTTGATAQVAKVKATTSDAAGGGFKLSILQPTAWVAEPGNQNTTFDATFKLGTSPYDATEKNLTAASQTANVHLTATADDGPFLSGPYEAEVVVTCD